MGAKAIPQDGPLSWGRLTTTSCAFGGPDLDILFVTTASQNITAEELAAQPYAGALLALPVGVRGLPEPRFAWPPLSSQADQ